jgi:nitrogen fixation-related uncharacterized protein
MTYIEYLRMLAPVFLFAGVLGVLDLAWATIKRLRNK